MILSKLLYLENGFAVCGTTIFCYTYTYLPSTMLNLKLRIYVAWRDTYVISFQFHKKTTFQIQRLKNATISKY